MSEERNDITPRRRRFRNAEEGAAPAAGTGENHMQPADAGIPENTAQTQGPYSRVPEEARRMSASPYGAANTAAVHHRTGSQAALQKQKTASQPIRQIRAETERQRHQNPVRNMPAEPMSRVRVGYAPGRMSESAMNRETDAGRLREQVYAKPRYPASTRSPYARPIPETLRNGNNPYPAQETPPPQTGSGRKGTILHILAALLIAAGMFLAVVLMLPKESGIRQQVASLAEKATAGIRAMADTEASAQADPEDTVQQNASPAADQFASTDDLNALLGNNAGSGEDTVKNSAEEPENTAGKAEEPAAAVPDGEPARTEQEPEIPAAATVTEQADETAADGSSGQADGEKTAEGTEPDGEPEPDEEPDGDAGSGEDAGFDEAEGSDEDAGFSEDVIADEDAVPDEDDEADTEVDPAEVPEPEKLTAQAVPAADPKLIKNVYVYSGKKQVKDYARPAKDLIHMPSGWEYTRQQIGVLTFRGNAFRTNGAVGTVGTAETLEKAWEAESGYAKGASQTYYGTGWPGQPAIVKWSTQIRENSNLYEKFKTKEGLKEVVVAGLDGVIRFMDLETGQLTRNGIKLGYPMRGTPSLHPSGYPYMSVGQFARKMKSGQGKIGLRQYNMYNENEITLINGTEQSLKPFNSTGSFETSALIDRVSDTAVVAGTNGLLYLIDLNSELDWQVGIYKSKQAVTALKTKANNQKNNMTAVESSPAMYDKYVFYADMGGILRCVDTDFLNTIWAVDTKDAVMATVALDQQNPESLDLYTANMLKNRKSGNAQIRRFDAMTGKELWCVEIGVKKDKKNNTDTGCKASPVIGENSLGGLVYFTVTGLSDDGRSTLGLSEEAKAAVVALRKEDGKIAWAYGLSDRSESSPIAVYDEAGNGWIIQCAWDGSIVMLNGLSGELAASASVDGNIEASPAAYNDMMVIGTTGKGTERIYGFRIGAPAEGNSAE